MSGLTQWSNVEVDSGGPHASSPSTAKTTTMQTLSWRERACVAWFALHLGVTTAALAGLGHVLLRASAWGLLSEVSPQCRRVVASGLVSSLKQRRVSVIHTRGCSPSPSRGASCGVPARWSGVGRSSCARGSVFNSWATRGGCGPCRAAIRSPRAIAVTSRPRRFGGSRHDCRRVVATSAGEPDVALSHPPDHTHAPSVRRRSLLSTRRAPTCARSAAAARGA